MKRNIGLFFAKYNHQRHLFGIRGCAQNFRKAECKSFCMKHLIPDGDADLHHEGYNKWPDIVAGPQMDVRVHGLLSSTTGNLT